jgi:hypothetical protein
MISRMLPAGKPQFRQNNAMAVSRGVIVSSSASSGKIRGLLKQCKKGEPGSRREGEYDKRRVRFQAEYQDVITLPHLPVISISPFLHSS